MGNARRLFSQLATAGVLASGTAQAALHDRGGGLLYDDVLNVTWLQDADYAKTSGYDADGSMTWADANIWAGSLAISRFVGESLTGWRLASNAPVGSDWNPDLSFDGSTDRGYNIISPHSELSYMYYVNLGLKGYYSPTGHFQSNWGIFGNGTCNGADCSSPGQNDVGLVRNLRSAYYWSGTPSSSGHAWSFRASDGSQGTLTTMSQVPAWAVRDGDVAAVPEPETYAMFLTGLAVMGGALRRRTRKGVSKA